MTKRQCRNRKRLKVGVIAVLSISMLAICKEKLNASSSDAQAIEPPALSNEDRVVLNFRTKYMDCNPDYIKTDLGFYVTAYELQTRWRNTLDSKGKLLSDYNTIDAYDVMRSASAGHDIDYMGYTKKGATTQQEKAVNSSIKASQEKIEVQDCSAWYIPEITLDYDWEKIYFPKEYQEHIWNLCQEKDLDYFLIMGIIARESRFEFDVENQKHYGFMQLYSGSEQDMKRRLDDETLSMHDPYDNITLGIELYDYCLKRTGYEYGALWAYAEGVAGFNEDIAQGQVSNEDVQKAYKFKTLLEDEELNPRGE